jgi:para-aminobenzoate synthetase component I
LRSSIIKNISNPVLFKKQLFSWSKQFREVAFLDSNNHKNAYSSYDSMLAVDAFTSLQTNAHLAFEDLNQYQLQSKDWLFGYFSYDLKNEIEALNSSNFDGLDFPDLFFFQPKKLFLLKNNKVEILYLNICFDEIETDFEAINKIEILDTIKQTGLVNIEQRISQEDYLKKVSQIAACIQKGSIYELNFCMEFYKENAVINPFETFNDLNKVSKSPFAAFLKNNQHYLLSASPERFLKKHNNKVISQPIKGTAKRHFDKQTDENAKIALKTSLKERSENIMIVDLVRNDLSHTAEKGSVIVEELCEIYTFEQVHQMISTVVSKVTPQTNPTNIIKTTFPMGSMTGAPKIAAMQLIEQFEESKRGLYSGAMGYFTPENDFDFNVVIRSILYNAKNQYLSFSVGSAITALSKPKDEYQECLLKAKAIFKILRK